MRRMRHLKPREIHGCTLALDASIPTSLYDATSGGSLVAADGAVARWEDQSGNARHVTQSTSGALPALKEGMVGGVSTLQFDGGDYLLSSSVQITDFATSGTDFACVVVQNQTGSDAFNTTFGIDQSASNRLLLHATFSDVIYMDAANNTTGRLSVAQPSGWDGSNQVVVGCRVGANAFISANNVVLATSTNRSGAVSSATTPIYIGAAGAAANMMTGTIAYVALFAGASAYVARRAGHAAQRKWRING